jgi:hypothetical protein
MIDEPANLGEHVLAPSIELGLVGIYRELMRAAAR